MSLTEHEVIAYLKEELSPELILLGGSRVVGQERPDSDWDLYLIGDYPLENERIARNFKGVHLDGALFPIISLEDKVLRIYYGPLKALRPLIDNEAGDAAAIAAATQIAYQRGPGFPSDERTEELTEDASRLLSKIEGYTQEPAVAQFHMASFYQLVLPAWFELRGRWSVPAHEAIPLIRKEDPDFSILLERFSSGSVTERIQASRRIFARLFGTTISENTM